MTDEERAARQSIIDACLRMNALGINQGTSGNISIRWKDGLLVTPTSTPYDRMKPEDIVFMRMDGSVSAGRPSSEWRFHRDIYAARRDVHAIVCFPPAAASQMVGSWARRCPVAASGLKASEDYRPIADTFERR